MDSSYPSSQEKKFKVNAGHHLPHPSLPSTQPVQSPHKNGIPQPQTTHSLPVRCVSPFPVYFSPRPSILPLVVAMPEAHILLFRGPKGFVFLGKNKGHHRKTDLALKLAKASGL